MLSSLTALNSNDTANLRNTTHNSRYAEGAETFHINTIDLMCIHLRPNWKILRANGERVAAEKTTFRRVRGSTKGHAACRRKSLTEPEERTASHHLHISIWSAFSWYLTILHQN